MKIGTKIRCIDPIEGYLTLCKEYEFQGIESYAGRCVVTDDNGREGHFKPERFIGTTPMNVKLTKVTSTHNNLRTSDMVGQTLLAPDLEKSFFIFGEGLEFGTRVIQTTEIQTLAFDHETRTFTFTTLNSTYKLEVLDKDLSVNEMLNHGKVK